jgi:hypothetical protein
VAHRWQSAEAKGQKNNSRKGSMNYLTVSEFESKLLPGLKYKLKKMSYGRRMAINAEMGGVLSELADINRERQPLIDDIEEAEEAAKLEPCICKHPPTKPSDDQNATDQQNTDKHDPVTGRCIVPRCHCREAHPSIEDAYAQKAALDDKEMSVVLAKIWPIRIRALVDKIEADERLEGRFEINGQPATIDSLLSDGPEPLIGELAREVNRLFNLTGDEALAFRSPGTSGAVAAGQTSGTNAPTANETSSTPTATA